ncbi:MAG TPA: DUF2510 domain-containing protein [Acidimicrobiales bacterium]|nr:DUF2510 domain-containing protein [Acidimicrobiales bacterium]
MLDLVLSKPAMVLGTVASALWALGSVLDGLAYAVLSSPGDLTTTDHLATAGAWLSFVSGLVLLCAVVYVAWGLLAQRRWQQMWEAAAAGLATLVFAIGLLVAATQATNVSEAANVVAAVGVGGWAALLVVGAARRALSEQASPGVQRQAGLRLAAAGSLIVAAIGFGLPNASLDDATLAVANAVVFVAAFAALVTVLSIARARGLLVTRQFQFLALGLWVLVAGEVVRCVASGIVFGPPPYSVTSIRVGLSLPAFVGAVGFVVLGWAALGRVGELATSVALGQAWYPASGSGQAAPATWAGPPEAAISVPPSWQPDPAGRHEVRWWDGVRWTEHVLDRGQPSVDPPS